MTTIFDHFVQASKRVVYGSHGEPYRFAGQTLRFVPGTRPIRLKYLNSPNVVNRHDALSILWMEQHLREGDTAIDVGACYGVYSLLMAAKCNARGRVIAFEPDPYAREVLRRNIVLNPNIKVPTVEEVACAERQGTESFFVKHGNSRSCLVRAGSESETLTVKLIKLDNYIAEHHLTPRIIKIDAEGAEIRILKGATCLLISDAEILCELHPFAWKDFGNSFDELQTLLRHCNRRIRYVDQDQEASGEPRYGVALLERGNPSFSLPC
jgi:FkbM family methyltransferase